MVLGTVPSLPRITFGSINSLIFSSRTQKSFVQFYRISHRLAAVKSLIRHEQLKLVQYTQLGV